MKKTLKTPKITFKLLRQQNNQTATLCRHTPPNIRVRHIAFLPRMLYRFSV